MSQAGAGPSSLAEVDRYFVRDTEKNAWVCQVIVSSSKEGEPVRCGEKLSISKDVNIGTQAYNRKRHILRRHPEERKELERADKERAAKEKGKKQLGRPVSSSAAGSTSGGGQKTISSFYLSNKVTVTMTKETYIDCIVRQVVKEGAALRFFSSDSYKLGHGELAQKVGVSLERDAVTGYVLSAAEKLKDSFREQVKDKCVFVKLDCATRLRTNYLGVTVRFIDKSDNPVTKTLALVDTKSRHTSRDLKALLMKILDDFNISLSRVVCIVTDNASNNVKMMKDLNLELASSSQAVMSDDEDSDSLEDDNENEIFENSLRASLPAVTHIRCGMHTFQLAILDGLKNPHAAALLSRCRMVARECLTPKIHEHIKKEMKTTAVLDQDTRWGSTYEMVEKLVRLKPIILEIEALGRNEKLRMMKTKVGRFFK